MKRELTWTFRDPFHLIKRDIEYITVKRIIEKALAMWCKPTAGNIKFVDISSPLRRYNNQSGDLDILFAKYKHGDKEPFDGYGGIIAHSGYPSDGIVHLDASEPWSANGQRGLDIRYVILHELGHALGLRHSEDKTAIMHPYYNVQMKDGFRLADDDVEGIQKLYGDKETV
uniref:ZnMc domain-containing protein n=1 Tax=Syphacia muris TaxID=451379 RepID=A0A0N5AXU1_9BILA